jgi:hypothetical protein
MASRAVRSRYRRRAGPPTFAPPAAAAHDRAASMYRALDSSRIVATAERLRDRIRERFPGANLALVADELVGVARGHAARCAEIQRPNRLFQVGGLCGFAVVAVVFALAVRAVHPKVGDDWALPDLLQAIEAALGSLVFVGASVAFAWSLDARRRRRLCLEALHEMRAMAHIVDMHQLTKDPEIVARPGPTTPSSPERPLDCFELGRYLDYCSEMLSLIGKVAALYVQGFPDQGVLQAVDDIESLTTSLSRKIWQKIALLQPGAPSQPGP